MPYIEGWEEFSRAAEKLYRSDPWRVRIKRVLCESVVNFSTVQSRFVVKYRHKDSSLILKMTNNDQVGSYCVVLCVSLHAHLLASSQSPGPLMDSYQK